MKMDRKYFIYLAAVFISATALVIFGASRSEALFGLTIEELINRAGVVRVDRIADLRDNIMRAIDLTKLIPEEYRAADIKKVLDVSGMKNAVSDFSAFKSTLAQKYSTDKSLWDFFAGTEAPSGANEVIGEKSVILSEKSGGYNWSKNLRGRKVGNNAFEQGSETDLYKGVTELVQESYGKKLTPGFKSIGIGATPGTAFSAYLGSQTVSNAFSEAYPQMALNEYVNDAGTEKIKKITELLAAAEIVHQRIEEKISGNLEELKALKDTPEGSGAAWNAMASTTASTAKIKLSTQEVLSDISELMKIRLEMQGQLAALKLPIYNKYAYDKLVERHGIKHGPQPGFRRDTLID